MRISDWSSDVCSSDLLHGVEGLGGMEAKDFACAEAPDALPFVAAAEGVGCVKHELQPMVVGDGLEFVNRRSTAPEVHADNPGGTRSDHAPHGIRIEIVQIGRAHV